MIEIFKERYTRTFHPGEVTTYQTRTIDDKRYGKTKQKLRLHVFTGYP